MPKTSQDRNNHSSSLHEISERIDGIRSFLGELLPEKHLTFTEVEQSLRDAGFTVQFNHNRGKEKMIITDPITKHNTHVRMLPDSKKTGQLVAPNYGDIKHLLNRVLPELETKRGVLETTAGQAAAAGTTTLSNHIADALDIRSQNISLEVMPNDKGGYIAHFTLNDAPYLHWDMHIPANVMNGTGIFNQNAFTTFLPTLQAHFDGGLNQAKDIVADLDHDQKQYGARLTYDAQHSTLTIHQDELDKHLPIKITNLADLRTSIDDRFEIILGAAENNLDMLKKELRAKCEGKDGLGLTCMFGNVSGVPVARITNQENGFRLDAPLTYTSGAEIRALIDGGLKEQYKQHRRDLGVTLPASRDISRKPKKLSDKPVFAARRFPEITAQSGQSLLRLTDSTDMEKVRDAILKLQSIEFTATDDGALDHFFGHHDVNHGTVKAMFKEALKAIGKDARQLRADIEAINSATSPLLSEKDHITKNAALQGLTALTRDSNNLSRKTSGDRGFTHVPEYYPDDIRSILHILDFYASQKAESMGQQKVIVELGKSAIAKEPGIPTLLPLRGRTHLAPEKKLDILSLSLPVKPALPQKPSAQVPADAGAPAAIDSPAAIAAVAFTATSPEKELSEPSTAAPIERTTAMPTRKYLPTKDITDEDNNGISSHKQFGSLVRKHRIERDWQEGEFAQALHDKAASSRKPLEEEVTAATVKDWESFQSLPKQSTFDLIKKVLIDENEKIRSADKEQAAADLESAYQSALLAFARLDAGKAGRGDFAQVQSFVSRVKELREQTGLADDVNFARAIRDASGPNISEDLDEVKNWKFVAAVESGRKPSPGMKDVTLDTLHERKSFRRGERDEMEESYQTTFADKVGHRPPQNDAADQDILAFIGAKQTLRSFFRKDVPSIEICKKAFSDRNYADKHLSNLGVSFFGNSKYHSKMSQSSVRDMLDQLGALIDKGDDTVAVRDKKQWDAACEVYLHCYSKITKATGRAGKDH